MTRSLKNNDNPQDQNMSLSHAHKSGSPRQAYIGYNGFKLTIVDADKVDPEKAFILRLPEETLQEILAYAAVVWKTRYGFSYSEYDIDFLCTLAITCRRLRRSALPLMYRKLEVSTEIVIGFKQIRLPLEEETMSLFRANCRTLALRINDELSPAGSSFDELNALVCNLPHVCEASFRGGFESQTQQTWELIRLAWQNMPYARSLEVGPIYGGLLLGDIFKYIDFASLESLHLSEIWRPHGVPDEDYILDPNKKHTAAFTSLTLQNFQEGPVVLKQLLRWPKALKHLHITSNQSSNSDMDLSMFDAWLSPHRKTLRTIEIGYLSAWTGRAPLNASVFPSLESLTLSRWQLGNVPWQQVSNFVFSPAVADLLLAPSLHTFGLDFAIVDEHSEGLMSFGDAEEQWLRELARAAVSRNAKLRRIKIRFRPHVDLEYVTGEEFEFGYPWDRMDRLRDEIALDGIVLEYGEPTIPKEEWLEAFRQYRATNGEGDGIEVEQPSLEGRDIREYFALPV